MSSCPNLNDIAEAYNRISGFIHKTPILTSLALDQISNENAGSILKYEIVKKGRWQDFIVLD